MSSNGPMFILIMRVSDLLRSVSVNHFHDLC